MIFLTPGGGFPYSYCELKRARRNSVTVLWQWPHCAALPGWIG